MKLNGKNGFIALGAVLIVTAFVLVLGTAVALTAFLGRAVISGSYYKEISRGLAQSCVQKAMLELATDPLYSGNEIIEVRAGESCEIISVTASSTDRVIRARAVFQDSYSSIQAVVDSALRIRSWEEPKSF